MIDEVTKIEITIVSAGILLMLAVLLGGTFIRNKMDNVPVRVAYQGRVIYEGPSCGVVVTSAGDTTTVKIKGGFLYLFPKAYYSGHGVTMEGSK